MGAEGQHGGPTQAPLRPQRPLVLSLTVSTRPWPSDRGNPGPGGPRTRYPCPAPRRRPGRHTRPPRPGGRLAVKGGEDAHGAQATWIVTHRADCAGRRRPRTLSGRRRPRPLWQRRLPGAVVRIRRKRHHSAGSDKSAGSGPALSVDGLPHRMSMAHPRRGPVRCVDRDRRGVDEGPGAGVEVGVQIREGRRGDAQVPLTGRSGAVRRRGRGFPSRGRLRPGGRSGP